METIPRCKNRLFFVATGSVLLATLGMPNVHASGAVKELESALDHYGVVVGGWANGGVTYNGNEPANNFNGPVTFGDRASEFQLNQLNMFIQRAVAAEGSSWDFGGRFDIMFGTDSVFTQAYGVPAFDVNTANPLQRSTWDLDFLGSNSNRFYDLALPQAYLETYVPVGNGLNIKAGHFYTPIGYETVPAPDNFFYTHAYTMQYGEPFTHTGVMGNYTVDDNWAVMGGLITGSATGGWDGGWDKNLGNWAGLAGVTWTSTDKDTSLNVAGTYGDTSEHSSKTWALYSIVLKHNITDKARLVLQHDHGFANGTYDYATGTPNAIDAEWYGINSHFYYDVSETVTAGLRAEWFRDQNGLRVCSPGRVGAATDNQGVSYAAAGNFLSSCAPATYYGITAGATWKPKTWLSLRPNVRYDWVEDSHGYTPFLNGKTAATDQILFSTDVTVSF
jgi:hypothetical protein